MLSGDRPETVAAIAREAGVPEKGPPLDGSDLPSGEAALAKAVLGTSVIGRISPEGKKRVVEALRAQGRYVAMIGDGVNDVPALKACQLGIAQGSGSQMARSVADLVLVQNDFGSVPDMVVEGRKVLRNLTRVTKLFVTKSAFAVFLVVSIGLTPIAYPLLPRHLSLVASLAIGIPGFFLALAPSAGEFRIKGFLRDIARFALPAGTAAGLGVLSSYLFVHEVLDETLKESRTVASTVLLIVGLYLILALESTTARRGAWVGALCAVLGGLYAVVLILPFGRHFYALAVPGPASVARHRRRLRPRDRRLDPHGQPLHPRLGPPPLGRRLRGRLSLSRAAERGGGRACPAPTPGLQEIAADAAVAALELGEHVAHHLRRRGADAQAQLALRLVARGVRPGVDDRADVVGGEAVVVGDVLDGHADQPEEHGAREPGAVLAGEAVDDDGALGRVRDRLDRAGEVRRQQLEHAHVGVVDARLVAGLLAPDALELVVVAVVDRHVDDLHRRVERRVALELVVPPEVDDRAHAVVDERVPARRRQVPHAVGPHDRAEPRRPAALGDVPAQVTDVEAPLPAENALGHTASEHCL